MHMKKSYMSVAPFFLILALALSACSTGPKNPAKTATSIAPAPAGLDARTFTPVPGKSVLADKIAYSQKDPRWASHLMGGSGDTMETDGCLVTATAMVLTNLGLQTNPGELNAQLKSNKGYTNQGWLVWSAIDTVTKNQATARYYDEVSEDIIEGCMADGFYPLARFILPSGRSHWAMILRKSQYGYHMRDPLHPSDQPLIFPRGVDAFKAIRCVGKKI